jgi:RNA polymerase sigma factor (TIGR02999 family)
MQTPERGDITQLLDAWRQGEREADDRLFARLYPDLKRLAAATVLKIRGAGSLQATELLHEAFLSLRGQRQVHWQNRDHFFSIAARVLRRTLVDTWRHQGRQKRGGGQEEIPIDGIHVAIGGAEIDRLVLEQALRRLADVDPVAARTVELLAIQGFSYDEAARRLGVGRATVSRGWRFARTFLRLQIEGNSTAENESFAREPMG